jgi:valyl-tRNA synthetase
MALCERYGKDVEEKWQRHWEEEGTYLFDESDARPVYSIDTPPPFTSGELHMGHVLSYSYFDFVARYKRMRGFAVYYPQGWDCQGFPTEVKVEQKYGRLPREEFRKRCVEWTGEFIERMRSQMKSLGFSADWRFEYRTMDPSYHRKVQLSLLRMHEKGLIYRSEHPVFWCTNCLSALAKTDTEDAKRQAELHYVNFTLAGKPLQIATTRPELMHACVAVLYHPSDARYSSLGAKKITTALGAEVPFLPDSDVDKEFGSGVVMVCTFGDKQDVVWMHRHKLPTIRAMDEGGRLTNAGALSGLKCAEAKKKMLEKFASEGRLVKSEGLSQAVKLHDRCKKPVELLLSMQWFAKITGKSDGIIAAARKIKWAPDFGIQYLVDWAKFVEWDWVISRQRVFGTPIPFWIDKATGKAYPAKESELPFDPVAKPAKKGEHGEELTAETSTCDCWVDSSITPLIISRWLEDDKFFSRAYPSSLRPQGVEIVRTWAFYTIYRCNELTGKPPFREILLNGNVLAPDGKKMSKSLGNIIAPDKLIADYSADAVRTWAALSGAMAKDRPFSYQDMQYSKSFLTKMLNAAKLVEKGCSDLPQGENAPGKESLRLTDRWILSRLQRVKKEATEDFESFQFHHAAKLVQDFFWHEFCDFYLEYVKHRLYSPEQYGAESRKAAQHACRTVLLECCQLLAPITPHLCEEIWQSFQPGRSIHLSPWPPVEKGRISDEDEEKCAFLNEIVAAARLHKAERKLPLNAEIASASLSAPFPIEGMEEELAATARIKLINFSNGEKRIVFSD